MAAVKLEKVNKIYDNQVQAVFDFNLDIKDKEFVVFVGPSGCGKSTTLRMIAGLEDITYGNIFIGGRLVNEVVSKDRDIAMVFQNYALFPHMTVYDNIAFGLKIRKIPVPVLDKQGNSMYVVDKEAVQSLKTQIDNLEIRLDLEDGDVNLIKVDIEKKKNEIENLKKNPSKLKTKLVKMKKDEIDLKVNEAAEILGLKEYLKRKPANLSGGQRQRVALGRAIVRNPKVFLMDEPLSNLDAKLRVVMRSEILRIHKKLGATTIYVTHDQTEAMTMADRIVIMKAGYIQQIGTPTDVYYDPENVFVAGFIGSPSMNFIKCKFDGSKLVIEKTEESNEQYVSLSVNQTEILNKYVGKEIVLGIRPEDIYLKKFNGEISYTDALVHSTDSTELLGNETILYGTVNGQTLLIKADSETLDGNKSMVEFFMNSKRMYFFDIESEKRIR